MKRRGFAVVNMPSKGIIRRRGTGQATYIYYVLRAYRNKKGKPTSDTALIGKLADDGKSLIPNTRYFELFSGTTQKDNISVIDAVRSSGTTKAFETMADKTGLIACLSRAFPDKHAAILTSAS